MGASSSKLLHALAAVVPSLGMPGWSVGEILLQMQEGERAWPLDAPEIADPMVQVLMSRFWASVRMAGSVETQSWR